MSTRIVTGIGVLFAALSLALPAQTQTHKLTDLPPDARPAELSVYLEAAAEGALVHACVGTDVKGRFGWYLRRAEAALHDSQKQPIGKSVFRYSGVPRVRVEATWEDGRGGKIVATATPGLSGRGTLPTDSAIGWQRYDVTSREGPGRISEAKTVFRISAWRTLPYGQPCDRSRAGVELRSPFTATDLFFR